ncbi:unnamed protein product [Symbiodinium sp. CCMP2592]|nr:unnamed protein product [Symbiodinium sp. CCMP2592]
MSLSEAQRLMISAYLHSAEQGKLVQAVDALHDYLLQEGLAWRQVLRCDCIGVHEENRDGLGLSAGHVSDLVSNISSIGFSAAEFRGVAIEIPPTAEGEALRSFNRKVTEESNGRLAPASNIRFASIVGSHANQAARCFWFQVPHTDDKLTVDNRLSLEKLKTVDAGWHRAIQEGMQWLIISHAVPAAFPQYTSLAQAAGNSAMQIASAEGEMQLARKVNTAIASFLKRTSKTTVEYADISAEILRSKPPHAASLPHIFSFVLKCGGGSGEGSYLSRTERFVRGHGVSNRSLGAEVWQALSADCKGPNQHVLFRHMLLKLGLCGATDKSLTVTDVKRSLTAKDVMARMGEAETVFLELQKLLQGQNAESAEAALGLCEIQMAAVVLQKKKLTQFDTIHQAAEKCLGDFGIASPWSLRMFDQEGGLVTSSRVSDLGFAVGMKVVRKADEQQGTIMEMSADKVRLKLSDGKLYEASSESFVQGRWKEYVVKPEPVLCKDWLNFSPPKSEEFIIAGVKGLVFPSMWHQYENLKNEKFDVFLKPSKDVQVKSTYNVHSLKLAIASPRVDCRLVSETLPPGALQVGLFATAGSKPTHTISVLPTFQAPKAGSGFINPLWLIKSTSDREEGNLEIVGANKQQKLTCLSTSVNLPMVRNYKKLQAADSLVLFRPDQHKAEEIENLQPVQKKARKACSLTRVAGPRSHPLAKMSGEENAAELEEQDDQPLKIYTATCISGGGLKGVWMPTIEEASGVTFIKLNKWDRQLTQYVTGKSLNLFSGSKKPKNSINVHWFQTMTDLRRQACNDSLKKLIVQAAEASGGKVPEKIRPATQADEFLAGRFVTVQAPPYKDPENPDAEEVDGPQLKLLWKLKTPDVWMELTFENLEYAKKAILGSPAWEQPISARAKHSPRKRRRRGPKPRGHDELGEEPLKDDGGEAALQNAPNGEEEEDEE